MSAPTELFTLEHFELNDYQPMWIAHPVTRVTSLRVYCGRLFFDRSLLAELGHARANGRKHGQEHYTAAGLEPLGNVHIERDPFRREGMSRDDFITLDDALAAVEDSFSSVAIPGGLSVAAKDIAKIINVQKVDHRDHVSSLATFGAEGKRWLPRWRLEEMHSGVASTKEMLTGLVARAEARA